jgi:hypothetical protein
MRLYGGMSYMQKKRRKGKAKIKSWDRMVAKFKGKFMHKDYQLNLFRQLQTLDIKL